MADIGNNRDVAGIMREAAGCSNDVRWQTDFPGVADQLHIDSQTDWQTDRIDTQIFFAESAQTSRRLAKSHIFWQTDCVNKQTVSIHRLFSWSLHRPHTD